ncbi:MAG: 2-oxoacid:ferredoxin oxidoreductase subunit beta [Deltaproteobacteria bacterium]|nr:MAG: 2-oxoacid:ferredoxin oxidoreductase subunit beta [Deltaproteobacteria bacterium]
MTTPNRIILDKYLRHNKKFPHIWCPGCGIGIVLAALLRAIDRTGWTKDEIVLVSGIGCSSRAPVYVDFNTLHTAHGRALPFATGIKAARPPLKVIVFTGDGDCAAIGGNHLIHACRRNIDVTTVVVNNYIYGMTGGQQSPTTPEGMKATTATRGVIDQPFHIAELAASAGATFAARSTTYHAKELESFILKALEHKGFSLVEAISQAPVCFGRRNGMGDPVEMVKREKELAIPISKTADMTFEEKRDKIVTGIIEEREAKEWTDLYAGVKKTAGEE